jgi:septal ring factor EnvC (AmiA/AmiB activator)
LALAARHDEQVALAAERAREIEALQAVQAKLAEEKLALAARHDEQVALAAERLKQLNELQQQVQSRQEAENDLRARQQHMQDEIIRAEAQLDLIKDMILRDAGL